MKTRFSDVMSGRSVGALVLASMGLALLAEAAISLGNLKLGPAAWVAFAVLGPLLLLLAWHLASSAYDRLTRVQLAVDNGRPPEPARALVITASPGGGVALGKHSIAAHHSKDSDDLKLEHLFILHTRDENGEKAFLDLRTHALDQGLLNEAIHEETLQGEAADQPALIYHRLQAIYERISEGTYGELREDEVIMDYTGGTSSFSAAMALWGAERGRRLQLARPRGRDEKGQPRDRNDVEVVEVHLDFVVKERKPRNPEPIG